MVRCGVAIYGMDPFGEDPAAHGLEPALSLRSWVAAVRRFEPGDSAGYGRRWTAAEPTWVATVPIGYGDGWRRSLTNNCDVLIRGRRHPLVGTVSMDNVTVALGPDTDVAVGRRGGADRRAGRGAHTGRGGGAPARHDQLRGHLRADVAGAPPASCRERGLDRRRHAARRAARPPGARRRRRGGRRPRARGTRPGRAAARAGVPALGGVRRLARDRPQGRPGLRLRAAAGRHDRAGPAPPRLHGQRDGPARGAGRDRRHRRRRRADRPARRPRRPGGAHPARARRGCLRERPAARAAAGALRRRARLRARPGDRAPHARGRAARDRGRRGARLRRAAPARDRRRRPGRARAGRPRSACSTPCCPS